MLTNRLEPTESYLFLLKERVLEQLDYFGLSYDWGELDLLISKVTREFHLCELPSSELIVEVILSGEK